jgi:hypothetical protein
MHPSILGILGHLSHVFRLRIEPLTSAMSVCLAVGCRFQLPGNSYWRENALFAAYCRDKMRLMHCLDVTRRWPGILATRLNVRGVL